MIINFNPNLDEGAVALVFRPDRFRIDYNIPKVRESGEIDDNTATGFLMALATLIAIEDEEGHAKRVIEAARRLEELELPVAPKGVN